ncbi:sensor histidine kinase [Paenibacillus chitinolyticus]|uniref:histidine kinase n=1 Tax=Paenibacillus chitinolyticus TaxID=79263 RepID=A0ABT4FA20_9BACL|nr:sensor histidine kinase [Paenibacillus chitinolyticus]MCY9595363.1 sensor histidine kinase [Paenibacillus chitinolyticus]
MSIRMKLFLFIPALVILMNSVTFFIYQSGRTIQESYHLTMDRILLYKEIAHKTEESLRSLSSYLINLNGEGRGAFVALQEELSSLQGKLESDARSEEDSFARRNYANMLGTYLAAADSVLAAVESKDMQRYLQRYEEADKTAGYIKAEHQNLVDMELSFYQPLYKQMLLKTGEMNMLGQTLVAVNMLLSLVFAIWLSQSITKPIGRLVHAARQMSKGHLDTAPPPVQNEDEIGILTLAFGHMQVNLKELIAKNQANMEKDRLVKELEIKALQSQINPHFLFNTLNVLSKLALLEGAEKTSDLTVSVSNLLRYNLRKLDQPVSLREEVDHAREYFAIQQSRFRDRISFETDIDEGALEQQIPCLTLQPLLENAFMHGIESMEEGAFIRLGIMKAGGNVRVTVADNGAGMNEETRLHLLRYGSASGDGAVPAAREGISAGEEEGVRRIEAPSGYDFSRTERKPSTGLGTQNVFRRLQLFYGTDGLIEIESAPGKGTTVVLTLPEMTGQRAGIRGDAYVPLADRG